jgi:Reverse transcriptase (RNA-dependent DNA polymerase)
MFNFHSTFLNGKLDEDEEVFMEQLPGYEESDPQKYCIKLYKSLYGLKQAGCKWYEIVCHMPAELGFKKCEADQAVFYIHASKDILIHAIHIDDCTMTWSSNNLIQSYKLKIKSKYNLMDLSPIHWLLGTKITRDCENRTISLSQLSYIDSLLRQFNFTDLSHSSTPMDPNILYLKNQCLQTPEQATKCATSLTVKLLAHSFTLPSPHIQILCS